MTAHSFELKRQEVLKNLNITVQEFVHTDTGLVHYHLACDNQENALMIGFATQPTTSRGEAHILEHVVLCGSKNYPVRDPFFSMLKRSLQTFMNAMTASDWTVYPFATQNKKDFFNLLKVYGDAVFFPNLHPLDFAQEGIRVQINEHNEPEYHGIVFNEMKGAMSGETDQLYHTLMPHLFGTTTYHHNSGGDPSAITDLTYEDLVAFHQKYYHPSNAVVMSFGDIGAKEIQDELQVFLQSFDGNTRPKTSERFFVPPEVRHSTPIAIKDSYSAATTGKNMTHQVIAWLLPAITDPKIRLAMQLMEGVLIQHSGLPLRRYLETTKLGQAPSPFLGLDDSHHEMVFYAGLTGSEEAHTEPFLQEILVLLSEVAAKPIDPQTIDTVLHQMELNERHIGGDSMPYGLTLMLEAFSTAIHGGDPLSVWQIDEHLSWLKEAVKDPMWLPNLIKTHLVDNPHRVHLTLVPDPDKTNKLIQQEQEKLKTLNQNLDQNAKDTLKQNALDLQKRQVLEDDISLLPKVGLEDVPPHIAFSQAQVLTSKDGVIYFYEKGTNGLYYYQLLRQLPDTIIKHPLLPLYLALLGELGTTAHDARQFAAVQAAQSSGVSARVSTRSDKNDPNQVKSYLVLATRALADKPSAIALVDEVLNDTVFDEMSRLQELLKERSLNWSARLPQAGHSYAMQTACRGTSLMSALEYAYSGLPALKALKTFLKQDTQENWQALSQNLQALHEQVKALPKSAILVCEAHQKDALVPLIEQSLGSTSQQELPKISLPAFDCLKHLVEPLSKPQDTAWLIASNVYHNAASYQAVASGHPDAPALSALAVFLRNNYLHSAIREKGGAYGGGASFDGNLASFRFYSYRDPHCEATFEHFKQSIAWFLQNEHAPYLLEECILSLIASLDKPASPAGDAIKACFNELHQRDQAYQNAWRQALLALTLDDLKRVATTYLSKPCVRACIAPIDAQDKLQVLGFKTHLLEDQDPKA